MWVRGACSRCRVLGHGDGAEPLAGRRHEPHAAALGAVDELTAHATDPGGQGGGQCYATLARSTLTSLVMHTSHPSICPYLYGVRTWWMLVAVVFDACFGLHVFINQSMLYSD